MNEELMKFLRAGWDQELEHSQRVVLSHAACPSASRLRTVMIDSSAANTDERDHIAQCRDCRQLLERLRMADHPATDILLRFATDESARSELNVVEKHMLACKVCPRLVNSKVMRRLREMLAAGITVAQRMRVFLDNSIADTILVPATSEVFGAPDSPFHKELTVRSTTLRLEQIGEDLLIAATVSKTTTPGAVNVALIAGDDLVEVEVPLTTVGDLLIGGVRIPWPWQRAPEPQEIRVLAIPMES